MALGSHFNVAAFQIFRLGGKDSTEAYLHNTGIRLYGLCVPLAVFFMLKILAVRRLFAPLAQGWSWQFWIAHCGHLMRVI